MVADTVIILYLVHQVFSLVVFSFCSFAVLRVLRQPSVGGEVKQRVDQSKQKTFNTIKTIMGTLVLRIVGNLVCNVINVRQQFSLKDQCMVIILSFWFGLPSSLVLPLLFLQRAGKLPSWNYTECDKQDREVNKNIGIHGKLQDQPVRSIWSRKLYGIIPLSSNVNCKLCRIMTSASWLNQFHCII